jgi:hypothetical protein
MQGLISSCTAIDAHTRAANAQTSIFNPHDRLAMSEGSGRIHPAADDSFQNLNRTFIATVRSSVPFKQRRIAVKDALVIDFALWGMIVCAIAKAFT